MKQGYLLPPPIDETGISPTSAGWNRCSLLLCGWRWDNSRPALQVEGMPPKTCSNLFNLDLPRASLNLFIMKNVRLTNLRLVSYWSAFLFFFKLTVLNTCRDQLKKKRSMEKCVVKNVPFIALLRVYTSMCNSVLHYILTRKSPLLHTAVFLACDFRKQHKYCVRKGCCEVRSWR